MTILKVIAVIVIYDFFKALIQSALRIWNEIDDFDDEDPDDYDPEEDEDW